MGEIQEQRFVCKICSKSCVSGKSLGGHMRVHLALISASKKAGEEKAEMMIKNPDCDFQSSMNQSNSEEKMLDDGYELRENPTKSWRISDSKKAEISCKECGKEFPSLRALSGHMRCHSIKNKKMSICEKCGKGFGSMRAMFGHMKTHSKRSRVVANESNDSLSDLENLCPIRRKRTKIGYNKTTPNPSFGGANGDVSELVEAEAAACLIMLSRGVRDFGKFESITELSDNDSVYFGGESSRRFYGCDGDFVTDVENKTAIISSSTGARKKVGDDKQLPSVENEMKGDFVSSELGVKLENADDMMSSDSTKYECSKVNSGKQVVYEKNSYENEANLEILEGFDKKVCTNTSFLSVTKDNSSPDQFECEDDDHEQEGIGVSLELSISKKRECPICLKVFSSGQALGGHKKAHYTGFAESKNDEVAEVHDMLDLNFPVNANEGSDVGLNMWRVDRSHEHEPLVLST